MRIKNSCATSIKRNGVSGVPASRICSRLIRGNATIASHAASFRREYEGGLILDFGTGIGILAGLMSERHCMCRRRCGALRGATREGIRGAFEYYLDVGAAKSVQGFPHRDVRELTCPAMLSGHRVPESKCRLVGTRFIC
jgi:hypothetical protein